MLRLPDPRGPTSEALLAALVRRPPRLGRRAAARRRRRRSPTTTSSCRSTSATSCTTAACRASTSAGSGRRRCSPCARSSRSASRPRCARSSGPAEPPPAPEAMDLALRAVIAADDAPVAVAPHRARGAARAACSSSSCTARPTSSRRPTRTPGRSRASRGAPKAALVEIQADEYGGGRPERMHARLFADAMDALGLDARYGAYLDRDPGRDARHGQPDVAVRPAPAPARARSSATSRCSR